MKKLRFINFRLLSQRGTIGNYLVWILWAWSEATCKNCLAVAAKSLQSCLTLCDPIDGSPPGSPIPGILQARTLEWVAMSFSNAWKWKVKMKSRSHVRFFVTPWTAAYQAPPPWDFPGKSTGLSCHCLLQLGAEDNPIFKKLMIYLGKTEEWTRSL